MPHSPLLTEVINTVVEQLHAAAGAQGSTWHLLLVGEASAEATDRASAEGTHPYPPEDVDQYR